jgi:hypothetical protein
MMLLDAILMLVMLFFLFLPICDRRTVRMRVLVLSGLMVVFAATSSQTHVPHVQVAGIVSTR